MHYPDFFPDAQQNRLLDMELFTDRGHQSPMLTPHARVDSFSLCHPSPHNGRDQACMAVVRFHNRQFLSSFLLWQILADILLRLEDANGASGAAVCFGGDGEESEKLGSFFIFLINRKQFC